MKQNRNDQMPIRATGLDHRHASLLGCCLAALLFTFFTGVAIAEPDQRPAFVPWPQDYQAGTGACVIGNGKRIVYDDKSLAPLAAILANDIRMATAVLMSAAQGKAATHEIALSLDNKLAKESYVLTVTDRGILVVGQNYNAVAMGTATLLQSMSRNEKGEIVVPAYVVKDWCFAEFSGLMLDIAREDHSLEVLRDVIDLCRFYKIRYFRLHFSDDQACLFPFEAFPQVTHGGRTWKLEEIKDLVRYGDERGVTLVPELETPGHSTFLCNRLPEVFGKGPGMDVTLPKVYETLDVMVKEISAVFKSSPYFHIGCDEATVRTKDQKFLQDNNLKNEGELFAWHVDKMNAIVKKYGKRTMAWECNSNDKDVISTVWNITSKYGEDKHGETDNTLKGGRPVVQVTWRPWIGDPLDELYDWRPYGKQMQYAREGMLGSEMVLWQNNGNVALRILRYRAPIRNEVTYNPKCPDTYPKFVSRFARSQDQFDRVATGLEIKMGANVGSLGDWMNAGGKEFLGPVYEYNGQLEGTLHSSIPDATIHYLLEEKESLKMPDAQSPIYGPEVLKAVKTEIGSTTIFKARLFDKDGKPLGKTLIREFHNNPFTVRVVGAIRKGDPRFSGAMAFDLTQHLKTGVVRYQINGPVTTHSPQFTKPFRIDEDATVTFQYFDETGRARGVPWRMLAREVDFDPYSLTYKKEAVATVGVKEFVELAVDGMVDKNECLNASDVKQALTVDLGKVLQVNRVVLHTFWNPDEGRAYQYTIELSEDNKTWTTAADESNNTIVATANGHAHTFDALKARYLRATVLGNNRSKGVEIAELRAYGPDQKPGVPGSPSAQEELNAELQADLQFIARSENASMAPAPLDGPWDLINETWGPQFNCKLVGVTDLGWQCGGASGVLDMNGQTLNWSTGGGNGTAVSINLTGKGGRINWDGGYEGRINPDGGYQIGWVSYPSDLRGDTPNTFTGVFHLRHGFMLLRKPPGVTAHAGDIEMGGADGLNESFLAWDKPDQLADTSSIITLPLGKDVKNQRATLLLQGQSETLGTLTVQTDTLIDLGGNKDQKGGICFADSSKQSWDLTKALTIKGEGTVRFGKSANCLTPAQLARVGFDTPQGKVPAKIAVDGTLTPGN